MPAPTKKPYKKDEDALPAIAKYILAAGMIIGIGYGSYLAEKANQMDVASLRASCSGGGFGSFGSCH